MGYAPDTFGQKHFGEPAASVWLVLLPPGPGWLNPITANHGESPQKYGHYCERGLKPNHQKKRKAKVLKVSHDYPSGMRWYPHLTRT